MLPRHDASPGKEFLIKDQGEQYIATFLKSKSNGELVFTRNDGGPRVYIDRTKFFFMRNRGFAVYLEPGYQVLEKFKVEPRAFEPHTLSDSPKVAKRKKRHAKASIKQYYTICIDEYGIPHSNEKIRQFIAQHADEHKKLFGIDPSTGKYYKAPGASSIIRYCRLFGTEHCRPYGFFLNDSGGDQRSGLWADVIKLLKRMMVDWYWSDDKPSARHVKAWFKGVVARERQRRLDLPPGDQAGDEMRRFTVNSSAAIEQRVEEGFSEVTKFFLEAEELPANFASPCNSTLQNWIEAGATLENIARREGRTVANRQVEGVIHNAVETFRPLQCVVMDHTQIDLHVVVLDENGLVVEETFRPWLIAVMDVHTRVVLAASLSIGAPSLDTLYAGLKQTLKPKDFLQHLNRGEAYAWSLDNFGLFKRMLVDNDLANIGRSMRATASAVGLNVSFAPVKTPTYKAIVERFFQTLNTNIWHEADGGVAEKPGVAKEDPRETARFTLQQAQAILWNWIITVYHMDKHSELGIPPALMWQRCFEGEFTRPLVADMNVIDNAFGRTAVRMLTTSGVEYRKEVFHHHEITTMLLDDLCSLTAGPRGTKRRNNTRSIQVELTERPTVGTIGIYNPARGDWVDLPNRVAGKNSTYEDEVDERRKLNEATENFLSRVEFDINVADHFASLRSHQPPTIDLTATTIAKNAVTLKDGRSSGRSLAASDRDQVVIQRPGVKRGGRAATSKAAATRAANRASSASVTQPIDSGKAVWPQRKPQVEISSKSSFDPDLVDVASNVEALDSDVEFRIDDSKAFLERMKAELKVSRE